ncbi:MAG: DUF1641 domain-containing protein [Acidobacteria bacterium]|nr:DUF1641 domain-containing protein [Acidobacteriota bacterium]
MARAVDFREYTPRDSRDDLIRRIEQAPAEHAEALLAAWDLLQQLHDKGVLDVLTGALSARDAIVDRLTRLLALEDGVTTLRTLLIAGKLVSAIDPARLEAALSASARDEPPSLLALTRKAASTDARRGLAATVALLEVLGGALAKEQCRDAGNAE